ncbi:MAG: OPT/YSL family transporter, partial [Phycisphaerales bacterium]|nr:OPT/YSL family transporter [Phycisphaerales bacterium]
MSEQAGGSSSNPFLDPNIPLLHEDATPEEKDLHWYKHVYQGDRMPQLTLRAVGMGAILGMLMSVSNLYTTLKVGWAFGVAITSCVLSYVIWNAMRVFTGGRLSAMSILENNCMQSTASAAGYSTGATISTCFGALLLLDPEHRHQPWWIVASFTLATGAMGVFLAIPMKRQMINQEQLAFPSGIAAATTLKSLYSQGAEAIRKAYALVAALIVGGIVGILNTTEGTLGFLDRFFAWMKAHLFSIQLPEQIPAEGLRLVHGKQLVGFGFESSVLLIAAGMIVGLRVSLSMLASAALLYFFITPWLVGIDIAHANDPAWVVSIPLVGGGTLYHPPRWGLWGGTAVMVFASLTSLALQWKTVARSFTMLRRGEAVTESEQVRAKLAAIEVPTGWLVAGMIPISIAMVAIQVVAFSIHWWAGVIAVAMSFVLSLVACRATGETDTTPIGAMGKVMQLTFALIMPRQVIPNLVSAGIAANSASSSADLLTDLKSGYLLGANPRKQFL